MLKNKPGPKPNPDSRVKMYFLRVSAKEKELIQDNVCPDDARNLLLKLANKKSLSA